MRRALLLLLAIVPLAPAQTTHVTRAFRPNSLGERLFRAVQNGDVKAVRALLAQGANPNGDEGTGPPPLSFLGGSPSEMLAVARLLVAHGAKVDPLIGNTNPTPLISALDRAQEPVGLVRYLLAKGANPNRGDESGFTPLHFAVRSGFAASVGELLARGARPNARKRGVKQDTPRDPELRDVLRVDEERRKAQLEHVFEPGYRGSGQTPIFGLAVRFDPTIARMLLKAGARLDDRDDDGWTPLHQAVQVGNAKAIQGLLALGADPNAPSKGGYTPLHSAMRVGFGVPEASIVSLLLRAGADPTRKNRDSQTPLELLRADVAWRLGNPAHDPQLDFPEPYRAPYLRQANDVARLLDPNAAPIVFVPPAPDPKGVTYAPLDLGDVRTERTVRVENGRAVLELRLPASPEGPAALTIETLALENYDALTPLPVVLRRSPERGAAARFEFPLAAAKGGGVEISYREQGPGSLSGSGSATDGRVAIPGFTYGDWVGVEHDLAGRTLEFEILSVVRGGKPLPGFKGRLVRVEAGRPAPIVGLRVDPLAESKGPKTTIRYRYRFLPNVRWRTDSIPLD